MTNFWNLHRPQKLDGGGLQAVELEAIAVVAQNLAALVVQLKQHVARVLGEELLWVVVYELPAFLRTVVLCAQMFLFFFIKKKRKKKTHHLCTAVLLQLALLVQILFLDWLDPRVESLLKRFVLVLDLLQQLVLSRQLLLFRVLLEEHVHDLFQNQSQRVLLQQSAEQRRLFGFFVVRIVVEVFEDGLDFLFPSVFEAEIGKARQDEIALESSCVKESKI